MKKGEPSLPAAEGRVYAVSSDFSAFLSPTIDRFSFLKCYLDSLDLKAATAALSGGRHLVLSAGPLNSGRPLRVFIAHYDRAGNSPGANDNSAAVFQLAEAAAAWKKARIPSWLIVFTDREEAAAAAGIKGQGSYAVAQGLKSLGLTDAAIYILDACGRGDTLVISTTADGLSRPGGLMTGAMARLRSRAMASARKAGLSCVLAPTPFSDDAGFLMAGLAAQTITVLPEAEASALLRATRRRRGAELAFLSREAAENPLSPPLPGYPQTWRLLHSANDNADSLRQEAFSLMRRFLSGIVNQ